MLYSENELQKRLKNGCGLYCFYAAEEALVQTAARRVLAFLGRDDPETTTLPGPTPTVEELIMAAGTISFFGGRRLVYLPMLKPSAYSDKDLTAICELLQDTENAAFVITCVVAEKYGRLDLGKREQRLFAACEKLGYCAQINRPDRASLRQLMRDWAEESGARFAPGADERLLDRCGDDQFLLQNEVEKLAAAADYRTITPELVAQLGTVTLEADTFEMARMVMAGQTAPALEKLNTLLALQIEPIPITGALIGNYLDMYRMLLARKSHRIAADVAHDFGYSGRWNRRLAEAERACAGCTRAQLERCLEILCRLDLDLKRSRLDGAFLLQKAICELALARKPA